MLQLKKILHATVKTLRATIKTWSVKKKKKWYVINKVLLYSTENYIQYPMINHNGKEYIYMYIKMSVGTFKEVQCLRPCASTSGGTGMIPVGKTKIPHATQ